MHLALKRYNSTISLLVLFICKAQLSQGFPNQIGCILLESKLLTLLSILLVHITVQSLALPYWMFTCPPDVFESEMVIYEGILVVESTNLLAFFSAFVVNLYLLCIQLYLLLLVQVNHSLVTAWYFFKFTLS